MTNWQILWLFDTPGLIILKERICTIRKVCLHRHLEPANKIFK
jgi:hypothetical protein